MKVSQVAGLALGWLAVALSMAAIGTAALGRVGVNPTEAQVQVTVMKPVGFRMSTVVLAPLAAPGNQAVTPSAIRSGTRLPSASPYRRPAATRTRSATAEVQVPATAPQPTAASTSAAVTTVTSPQLGMLLPEPATPTTAVIPTTTTTPQPTKTAASRKQPNSGTAVAGSSLSGVALDGPEPLAALVGCEDGVLSFSTGR